MLRHDEPVVLTELLARTIAGIAGACQQRGKGKIDRYKQIVGRMLKHPPLKGYKWLQV